MSERSTRCTVVRLLTVRSSDSTRITSYNVCYTKLLRGLTRELRDAQGEPAFGRRALAVLEENPAIEWEYIPEALGEITPEVAARYDGIYA